MCIEGWELLIITQLKLEELTENGKILWDLNLAFAGSNSKGMDNFF